MRYWWHPERCDSCYRVSRDTRTFRKPGCRCPSGEPRPPTLPCRAVTVPGTTRRVPKPICGRERVLATSSQPPTAALASPSGPVIPPPGSGIRSWYCSRCLLAPDPRTQSAPKLQRTWRRIVNIVLAPRGGLEPPTNRLTAGCSTIELPGNPIPYCSILLSYQKWGYLIISRDSPTFKSIPGNDLLSHGVATVVPSALEDLTSVFGMGTGVAPPLQSPGKPSHLQNCIANGQRHMFVPARCKRSAY